MEHLRRSCTWLKLWVESWQHLASEVAHPSLPVKHQPHAVERHQLPSTQATLISKAVMLGTICEGAGIDTEGGGL